MSERDRHPNQFDESALSQALEARPFPVTDPRCGGGREFRVGDGQLTLEIYPATNTTRLTTPTACLKLLGALTMEETEGGVVLTRADGPDEDVHVALRSDGALTVGYVHHPPEAGQRGENWSDGPVSHLPAAPLVPGPAPAPRIRSGDPLASPAAPSSTDESHPAEPRPRERTAERISLTGRLGRDPSFRTTKTGSLVARFPLAVHREDGHTDWHTVLAFGSRAEQLQRRLASGELIRGREVDVIGYRHVNTRPGKDGRTRQVQEVYAVAVKKR